MGPIGRFLRSSHGRPRARWVGLAVLLVLLIPGGTFRGSELAARSAAPAAANVPVYAANASYRVGPGDWNCGQGHQTIDFFGSVEGGTPPYEFNWTFGDGSNASQVQDPIHTFTSTGPFLVNVSVRDSTGQLARANVSPAWAIPLFCGGQPTPVSPMTAILFVALVGVVVVAGVVVVRWRRPTRPLP